MLKRLDDTERAVNQIPTPLAYAENLYFFREHVDVVRRRIARRLSRESLAAAPAAAPMRASEGGRLPRSSVVVAVAHPDGPKAGGPL